MSEHDSTPRTGALRPDEESDLDRVVRGVDGDGGGDETPSPAPGALVPSAGEGVPARLHADHQDAAEDPSYPTLRGDTADQEARRH